MTAVARSSAYDILLNIVQRGKYSNVALQQYYRDKSLDARDKALCTEIVYGTIQYQRSIDVLLEPLCRRGLSQIDERVLVILRMAIYQLGYLSRVPQYAVLNDAVELCKRHARKAAGFVNGVLRSFTRDNRTVSEKLASFTENISDFAVRTGILLSYPDWFVEELCSEFGENRTLDILQACNRPASMSLRVNSTKVTASAFIATQTGTMVVSTDRGDVGTAAGDEHQGTSLHTDSEDMVNDGAPEMMLSPLSSVGIRLHQGMDVERWAPYQQGLVTVQDEASMLVAPFLKVDANDSVLDLCAGLGTKTTHILELQGGQGNVTSIDIHHHKLIRLQQAAERLGLTGVKTIVADARSVANNRRHQEAYDAVLLDAPCSGMGVLRRRPEIRWRRTAAESEALAALQSELLQAAVAAVKPGGVIVYATCTLLPRENRQVVETAVAMSGGNLIIEDISSELPDLIRGLIIDNEANGQERQIPVREQPPIGYTLTPELFETDGFYFARIRKIK